MSSSNADPALARLPARRHRLEHLHAGDRAGVGARRARRRRLLPGPRARALRPRRRRGRAPAARHAAARPSCSTATRASSPCCSRTCRRRERERYVARERGGAPRAPAGRPRLRQPRPDGRRRSARRPARRFAVKAHGSELEYSMRGQRRARGVGRDVARAARTPSSSAPSTSAGCSRTWSGTSTASTRCRRASTSTSSSPSRPRRGARRAARGVPAPTRPTRATGRSGCPTRATPSGSREFLAGRRADRPLLREAPLQQGRPRAARGAARARTRARSSSASATTARELERIAPPRTLFTGPLEHRHLVHLIPLADVAVVPSIFPEAFGMVAAEAAAAGCPPLVARHSGLEEVAAGLEDGVPAGAPAPRELRRPATRSTSPTSSTSCSRCRPATRAELGEAARRVAVEHWSWAGVARRLLEPVRIGFSLQWVKRRSCPTAS